MTHHLYLETKLPQQAADFSVPDLGRGLGGLVYLGLAHRIISLS